MEAASYNPASPPTRIEPGTSSVRFVNVAAAPCIPQASVPLHRNSQPGETHTHPSGDQVARELVAVA